MALFNVDDDLAVELPRKWPLWSPMMITISPWNNADHQGRTMLIIKEGQLLGLLEDATLLDRKLLNEPIVRALCTADSPLHSSSLTDWYQCLLEALKLRTVLSDDESLQLNELLKEYQHACICT